MATVQDIVTGCQNLLKSKQDHQALVTYNQDTSTSIVIGAGPINSRGLWFLLLQDHTIVQAMLLTYLASRCAEIAEKNNTNSAKTEFNDLIETYNVVMTHLNIKDHREVAKFT